MSYDKFESRVIPIFIYYIILLIFSIPLTISIFRKWSKKRTIPAFYLSIVFFLFTSALIMLTLGLLEAIITGYYMTIYRFSLPYAYSIVIVVDILLYLLTCKIVKNNEKIKPMVFIGILLILILFLPWNWWGHPKIDYQGKLNIRLFSMMGLVTFSYFTFIFNAIVFYKAKEKARDEVSRFGLTMLFYSVICMICFLLMMIIDTIAIVLFEHPGYSIFVYIAWLFALGFYILSYFALMMPEWIVKKLKKRKIQN